MATAKMVVKAREYLCRLASRFFQGDVGRAAKIVDPTERLARLFQVGQWRKRIGLNSYVLSIMDSMDGFGVAGEMDDKEWAAEWIHAIEGAVADGAKPFEAKFKLGEDAGSFEMTPVEWACRIGAVGLYRILARGLDPQAPWGLGRPNSFGWLLVTTNRGNRDPETVPSNVGRSEIIESIFDRSPTWSAQPIALDGGGEDLRQFVARSRSYGVLRMKAWELLRADSKDSPAARIAWAIGAAAEHPRLDPDMEQIRSLIQEAVQGMNAAQALEAWRRALAAAHEEHLGKEDDAALRWWIARKDWCEKNSLPVKVQRPVLVRSDSGWERCAWSAKISEAIEDLGLGPWLRSLATVDELDQAIEKSAGLGQSPKLGRL